jgi:hypothetical protein
VTNRRKAWGGRGGGAAGKLEDKRKTENGKKKLEMCGLFCLASCIAQRIWRNKMKAIDTFEQNG